MRNQRIVRDGHIHSPYCPHGTKDSFELYVEEALKLGLKEITFTEHMPLPEGFMEPEVLKYCAPTLDVIDEYFEELYLIKDKFKKVIKINAGFEVDYIEGYEEEIKWMLNRYGDKIEDSILSVHFIKLEDAYYCVDESPEEFGELVKKLGGVKNVYDSYYGTLLKAVKADLGFLKPKRIGHPTLVRIFNTEYPLKYRNITLLEEIIREVKLRNYEIEFNTAGVRKPYCKEIYPSGIFAELVERYAVNVVYGSDAHTALDIGRDFI